MIKRIHVNQHVIRRNTKTGEREAPLTVKTSRGNIRAHAVDIQGASRVVYSPEQPLACGARVWVQTSAPILVSTDDDDSPRRLD